MIRRLWERLKQLWHLARSERAAPREIGWAVAIGAFAGCTPLFGFHGWIAIGLATLLKKNRLFAWLGTRVSNVVFLPFITLAEIQLAHRLRTGQWAVLDRDHVLDQAAALLLDWSLGCVPVGALIAAAAGMLAWGAAELRDRRASRRTAIPPTPVAPELDRSEERISSPSAVARSAPSGDDERMRSSSDVARGEPR